MIIGTTSQKVVLDELEISQCFNVSKKVPTIYETNELTAVLSQYPISSSEMGGVTEEF